MQIHHKIQKFYKVQKEATNKKDQNLKLMYSAVPRTNNYKLASASVNQQMCNSTYILAPPVYNHAITYT